MMDWLEVIYAGISFDRCTQKLFEDVEVTVRKSAVETGRI
jgi:hypothetical protein